MESTKPALSGARVRRMFARETLVPERCILAPVRFWHLLSLDAPSVAALWAWSFARALRLSLPAGSLLLLFAGTWLLYITDRILDGFHQSPARLRERHFFYMRHRTAILLAAVPIAALLAWLVFVHMLPTARAADIVIFSVACAYFGLVHLPKRTLRRAVERWFPKELIVALVFASATAVPAFARVTGPVSGAPLHYAQIQAVLPILAILFAALCWLNCIAIEKWEQSPLPDGTAGSARNRNLPAQTNDLTTRWGQRHLRLIGAAVVSSAVLAAVLLLHSNPAAAGLCFAAALSAALLIALERSALSAPHLRIAADAALLTPLLLFFLR